MTKKEYLKYNRDDVYDMLGNQINVGDIVIFNSIYISSPHIGTVDHFCDSNRLAIHFDYHYPSNRDTKLWAYRYPHNVIKFKNGNKSKCKDKSKG